MEPLDYLKVLQRHWKMAVALVVVVLVVVWFLMPAPPKPDYEASHTLLLEASSGQDVATGADNPHVVALWATEGEVPQRVADALGLTGPVDRISDQVDVVASPELGTVRLTAIASSPEGAVVLVNVWAEQTLAFIDEWNVARAAEAREDAAAKRADLRESLQQVQQRIDNAGGAESPAAANHVAERDTINAELAAVQQEETDARRAAEWSSLHVATAAGEAEGASISVTRTRAAVLGVVVALLLALGVAIMLDRSDSRLHTKEQVERQFGLPVLTEVPMLSLRLRHRAAVAGYEGDAGVAEAYRSLRTALMLFRDRLPLGVETAELSGRMEQRGDGGGSAARQVIVVTSPEAGDGKSSSSANLAMAYAEAGQSVLLIQWDLWRPMPASTFGAEDKPGVSEYLAASNAPLVQFVQQTSVPGLHLLPAGALGHQPGAHLDAELRLLEEARRMADVVIIDTAPLLAASVTRELVTMADVVVVASRVGRTTSPAAGRTAELLERLGAPALGVVLVGVPSGLFNDYYTNQKPRTERLRDAMSGRLGPDERPGPEERPGPARQPYPRSAVEPDEPGGQNGPSRPSGPGGPGPFSAPDTVPKRGMGS
jgi:capsular exopolysaccharide synthesis family protein